MAKNSDAVRGPSQRQLRVGESIRHAVAELLSRGELHDDVISSRVITVSEVRMSPDLRTASIYIVPLGGEDLAPVLKAFNANKKYIRGTVARAVNLKYAPDLKFLSDDSFAAANRIDELLASPRVARDLESK